MCHSYYRFHFVNMFVQLIATVTFMTAQQTKRTLRRRLDHDTILALWQTLSTQID